MKKILLVEEDDNYRSLLADFLRKNGFQVIDTNNAMSALFLGKDFDPHLIIVNLELKGANAYQFMKNLRADASVHKTPFIVLTENPQHLDDSLRTEARDLQSHICFKKPVNLPLLLEFISIKLERNHQNISDISEPES
jgi:DNA-binding response OmpR family regulator